MWPPQEIAAFFYKITGQKCKTLDKIKFVERNVVEELFIKIVFNLLSLRDSSLLTVKFLAKLKSFLILDKDKRYQVREAAFNYYKTKLYGYQVLKTAKEIGEGFWCNGFSYVNENTVLKDYVCFNGMKITGKGNVTIGSHFHSGIENLIITQTHDYDTGSLIPYENTLHYNVEIGDFVWFGSRVTILPGTKIGNGAIIQAGAVVRGEIPPLAIVGGNPAVVFKYRDKEHFEKLLSEKRFF